jgi:ubiquinone/menaquinone biosynthesis C-methylase UbiE
MSEPTEPRREHPSAYFVQDRSSEDEMIRLQIQDEMLTTSMGGVLPEQPEPTRFKSVLDVGCGTGGWLIETAKMYPDISRLVGVDVSKRMIDYARSQAAAQHLDNRVEFRVMDALRMLEFPAYSFDLVNQRLGASFIRTWEWPKILSEYQRVSQPDGVIRVTEADFLAGTSSPAFKRLNQLFLQAYHQSGRYYTPDGNAVISQLARLLSQYAILDDVQVQSYMLEYRAGTLEGQQFVENQKRIFRTALPFLRKWLRVPDNYEEMYQQMLTEMQQPDFVATWELLTAWGRNSSRA